MNDSILFIIIGILIISNVIVSSIILVKQKTSENFTDTNSDSICSNSRTCQDGWQPIFIYPNVVTFPFGYEKVGDKCYCRPGLSLKKTQYADECLCLDNKGIGRDSGYYATNYQGDIWGSSSAKIGDECFVDTDCGQIRTHSNSKVVDYLSNLRCDAPYNRYDNPSNRIKGKCQDISTLYN